MQLRDGSGFEDMVRSYHATFVRCLTGLLTGGGPDDAEDLAQSVWSEVWRDMEKSPAEGGWDRKWSFMTYLQYKARFKVADFNRRSALERARWTEPSARDHGFGDSEQLVTEEELIPAVHGELLRLVMRCGGYPHEVLAFCMSRLIHASSAFAGSAGSVAQLYALEQLAGLAQAFAGKYRAADFGSLESQRDIEPAMRPLAERLATTGEVLFSRDGLTRRHYTHLQSNIVGQNRLTDYFLTDPPQRTIAKWTDKVRRNLLAAVAAPESRCPKCRYHPVDGCQAAPASTGGSPLGHLRELELASLARGGLEPKAAARATAHTEACGSCGERLLAWKLIVADPEAAVASWLAASGEKHRSGSIAPGLASALVELAGRFPGLKELAAAALRGTLPLVRIAEAALATAKPMPAIERTPLEAEFMLFEMPAMACEPMGTEYVGGGGPGWPRGLALSADNPTVAIVSAGVPVGSALLDAAGHRITVLLGSGAGPARALALLYDPLTNTMSHREFRQSQAEGWLEAEFSDIPDGEYELYTI